MHLYKIVFMLIICIIIQIRKNRKLISHLVR